jgi:hypothetical protein
LSAEADGKTGKERLRQRQVDHPLGAKALEEIFRGAEDAAVGANVLAQDEHAVILTHRPGKREPHRLDQCDLAHVGGSFSSSVRTIARRCASSSRGNSA